MEENQDAEDNLEQLANQYQESFAKAEYDQASEVCIEILGLRRVNREDEDTDIVYNEYLDKLIEIGNIFAQTQEYDKALQIFDTAFNFAQGDPNRQNSTLLQSADICFNRGDFGKAIERYKSYHLEVGNDEYALKQLLRIGNNHFENRRYKKTVELYEYVKEEARKSSSEYKEFENTYSEVLNKLVNLYRQLEDYGKAIETCLVILDLSGGMYIRKTIQEIADEQTQKAKLKIEQMIAQYTHTLGNTLYPSHIKQVVSKLKHHPELRQEALALEKSYQAEILIRQQGELLELKHTGNSERFRNAIRQSIGTSTATKNVTTIDELLNWATERAITRLLNPDYGKLNQTRKFLLQKQPQTLRHWRASFEEEVFFSGQKSAIEWANENLVTINYTLSPTWQKLKLKREDKAEAVLLGYLSELLINALKYYQADEWATIDFNEDEIYLTMIWVNTRIDPPKKTDALGRRGLDSIKNDLEMLNERETDLKSLERELNNQKFKVKLYLSKDVFSYQKPKTRYTLF